MRTVFRIALALWLSGSAAVSAQDLSATLERMPGGAPQSPVVAYRLVLPPQGTDDLQIALNPPRRSMIVELVSIALGAGAACDGTVEDLPPETVALDLGACTIADGADAAARTLDVAWRIDLRDASPFADAATILAAREYTVDVIAYDGGAETLTRLKERISAPLLAIRDDRFTGAPVEAGDVARATFTIVNRGDDTAELALSVGPEWAFRCSDATINGFAGRVAGCDAPLPFRLSLDPTRGERLTVEARLRDDVVLQEQPALTLRDGGELLAWVPLPLKQPAPPALTFGADGPIGIGGAIPMQVSVETLAGRTNVELRIAGRLIDETGRAVGPAPLRAARFDFAEGAPVRAAVEDGWTVLSQTRVNHLGPVNGNKPLDAAVDLVLLDEPASRGGAILELRAEVTQAGLTLESTERARRTIIEPTVSLVARSEGNRSLAPGEQSLITSLICNSGSADARDITLTLALSEGLRAGNEAPALRRLSIARRDDPLPDLLALPPANSTAVRVEEAPGALSLYLSDAEGIPAQTCALVSHALHAEFGERLSIDAEAQLALAPYRSGTGTRTYQPPAPVALRFFLPQLRVTRESARARGEGERVRHRLSLTAPERGGPFRMSLAVETEIPGGIALFTRNAEGALRPWRNGDMVASGETVSLVAEATLPRGVELGWVDTAVLRVNALGPGGRNHSAAAQMISRVSRPGTEEISARKLLAIDRNCDGNLDDERSQDAVFEAAKDAAPGECVVFRIDFSHTGERAIETIVIRDAPPRGTVARPRSARVLTPPEGVADAAVDEGDEMVWTFDGIFTQGVSGRVRYAVRIAEDTRQ